MYRLITIVAALALSLGVASAEKGFNPASTALGTPLGAPGAGLQGLLDTGKLDMQHTAGISFGTGRSGFSQYYLNTMTYKPAEKVTVHATLGVQNLSGAQGVFGESISGTRIVVPNVGVLYQPRPNVRIEIGFSNMPGYGYGYTPWGLRGF